MSARMVNTNARFRDDLTGQPLKPELVKAARRKELEYFNTKGVWTLRPRAEARERQGKPPITVKWVDVNKGDDEAPNYRSRLVAKDFKRKGDDSIFAPTPPLEVLRIIFMMAATPSLWAPADRHQPSRCSWLQHQRQCRIQRH